MEVSMNRKKIRFAAFILLGLGGLTLAADDHLVEEASRTYRGNTSPKQIRETWIGADRKSYKNGAFQIITRYDLKKIWTVNAAKKLYFEEDLPTEEAEQAPEKPVRIQELGWDYVPRYDYTARDTGEEQTINGILCRKYIVEGQADFAQETREIWIGRKVPIDLVRYDQKVLRSERDPIWKALLAADPALRPAVPMRTRSIGEPAIAPTLIWNFELTKVESAEPPDVIYDLPPGYAKAATRGELYRR
jgi:hypothetical protein